MAVTIHIFYRGENGSARKFAGDMIAGGTVDAIRAEDGNLRYAYFLPMDDPETVLLIDSWRDQAALDEHHASPMMRRIALLRDRYDLHMTVERYVSDAPPAGDEKHIRK